MNQGVDGVHANVVHRFPLIHAQSSMYQQQNLGQHIKNFSNGIAEENTHLEVVSMNFQMHGAAVSLKLAMHGIICDCFACHMRRSSIIRLAQITDIAALCVLEDACFNTDRLCKRNFHHLMTQGNAVTIIHEQDGAVAAYALVLFRNNSSKARLYSLAVAPAYRGQGIALTLINACEQAAISHAATSIRLEVHINNTHAIQLYHKQGYQQFAVVEDYYEDHCAAMRMEKQLA